MPVKNTEMQDELKQIVIDENKKRSEEYRKKLETERQEQLQRDLAQIKLDSMVSDSSTGHQKVDPWEIANKKASDAMNSEVMSYNDWRAAIMSTISLCSAICDALVMERKTLMTQASYFIRDQIDRFLVDKDPEKINLPALQYLVSYSADDKLEIEPILRLDNGKELGDLDQLFRKGVVAWLDERGYQPDAADANVFRHKVTNEQLSKTDFDRIKDDPVIGFGHYLEESSDLTFTKRP
jgi:hypothetical protein